MPTYAIYAHDTNDYQYLRNFVSTIFNENLDELPFIGDKYEEMINEIGTFDIALFKQLSEVPNADHILRKLEGNNVRVISVEDNYDSRMRVATNAESLSLKEQVESARMSASVKTGLMEQAKQGKRANGRLPIGYTRDSITKEMIINENEADIVRRVFDLYIHDGMSMNAIAHHLTEHGYKTKTGKLFAAQTIKEMLTNESYTGVLSYQTVRIEHAHPSIISERDFAAAQSLIKSKQKIKKLASNRRGERYLLSDILYCKKCGQLMHGDTPTGELQYRCTNNNCDSQPIVGMRLNINVMEEVKAKLNTYPPMQLEIAMRKCMPNNIDTSNKIRKLMRKIRKLMVADSFSNDKETNDTLRGIVDKVLCGQVDDMLSVEITYKFLG